MLSWKQKIFLSIKLVKFYCLFSPSSAENLICENLKCISIFFFCGFAKVKKVCKEFFGLGYFFFFFLSVGDIMPAPSGACRKRWLSSDKGRWPGNYFRKIKSFSCECITSPRLGASWRNRDPARCSYSTGTFFCVLPKLWTWLMYSVYDSCSSWGCPISFSLLAIPSRELWKKILEFVIS